MIRWLEGKRVRLVGDSPAIASALGEHGAVLDDGGEILIHIAAPPPVLPSHELSHEQWRAALDGGLDQRFRLAQDWAKDCREAGSGGAALFVGAPEQALGADHAAAAGALGNLTKTLAVEWARDGLRVNTILTRETGDTLGQIAAYLVSDYAAYVTGAVMGVHPDEQGMPT